MKFPTRFFGLFICLVLLSCFTANAQVPPPPFAMRTDLIPPSPNAAALGKYGLVPVSLQTGIPDISIPITTAVGQQLKVPVTLNYHNNGFKPSEEASWVGLGFSLDAGGVITRVVKDKVDELTIERGKYNNTRWRYNTPGAITNRFLDSAFYFGQNDTEPDVYAFNFSGYSGKFILFKGQVYQYPYQHLSISGDPSTGFTITTPDGNIYTFNISESTLVLDSHNKTDLFTIFNYRPSEYPVSWYLQTITSPDNKDHVTFTYSTADVIGQNGPGTQNMKVLTYNGTITATPIKFPYPVRVSTPRLTKITTSKMYINFNSSDTARLDVATTYALSNIEVYNYKGQLLNRFKFNTSYFAGAGTKTTDNSRLKLTGLDEGTNALTLKKTRFYYNELNTFPSKKLGSTDDWGYSNGIDLLATDNLIPKKYYPIYGADKTPNASYIQNNILTKIIYPTGGCTSFAYEQNITNNGVHYIMNEHEQEVDVPRTDPTSDNLIISYGSFTLNVAQTVHVTTIRVPKDTATTGPTKDFTAHLIITSGTQSYPFYIRDNKYNGGMPDSVALQPGTYTMQVQCDGSELYTTGIVRYVTQSNRAIEGVVGPGIRIKQITNYTDPPATKISSIKQYIYKDSIGVSTGYLLNIPNYGSKDYTEENYTSGGAPAQNVFRTYTSTNGSGMIVSQDMYYNKVYERDVSPKDTLLSMSTFNLIRPFIQTGTTVFLTGKTDYRQSGNQYKKVKSQQYNYSLITDSVFIAIKPYYKLVRVKDTGWVIGVNIDSLRVYDHDEYTIEPSWLRLNSTKSIDYYNTADSVITSSTYLYDANPRNRIMVTTTDSKGRTTVEKDKYRENYALSVFTPGISSVVEKQVWLKRAPTDSVLMNGIITQYDQIFYKPKTLYGFENVTQVSSLNQETKNGAGLYTTLLSDTRYKPRLTNTFESAAGNLTAQDMTNFSSGAVHQVAYLWGYHNNYPIAQVKNADLAAVAYTSFEDDDNSWTYTAANVLATDARTGVKCYSGTMSKSSLPFGNYSVSLWAKGSGTVTVGGVAKTITANWAWYEWQLTGITNVSISSGTNKIDEVRLLPANALMTTYTYSPEVGVTTITDTRGISQFFDYDEFERLANIKDKDGNIVKNFSYNYAVQGPIWTDTGTKQCVLSGGVYTGEEQMQQRDINPLSITYNQLQWRSLGVTGNCSPIYIKMTVASTSTSDVGGNPHTFKTYLFKSYSDANCTVPLTISVALTINYSVTRTRVFNSGAPNSVTTTNFVIGISGGGNSATSPAIDVAGCNGSGVNGSCDTSVVTLLTGTGYTPYNYNP